MFQNVSLEGDLPIAWNSSSAEDSETLRSICYLRRCTHQQWPLNACDRANKTHMMMEPPSPAWPRRPSFSTPPSASPTYPSTPTESRSTSAPAEALPWRHEPSGVLGNPSRSAGSAQTMVGGGLVQAIPACKGKVAVAEGHSYFDPIGPTRSNPHA